jgi:hypothetical protein
MKKKSILLIIILLVGVLFITGCDNGNTKEEALAFKEEYESINSKDNGHGGTHRKLDVASDNPYKKVSATTIVNMIKNKETFYVYFGFKECPWCRSVIVESINMERKMDISKVYYVDVLNIRDKMEVKDGVAVTTTEGSKAYMKLLSQLKNVLDDYDLGTSVKSPEKRIYAPNFIKVVNGKAVKMTEGISKKQTDAYQELTSEIKKDEDKQFKEFFK